MARSQERPRRRQSGARLVSHRGKRKFELAGYPTNTKVGELKSKSTRTIGGNSKESLLAIKIINISDKKGKSTKAEITNVLENPANPNLVRRNVITKGTIVETKLGKVRVTSRPGQEASVNGVLV